jgi:GntR family transcriptional regulator
VLLDSLPDPLPGNGDTSLALPVDRCAFDVSALQIPLNSPVAEVRRVFTAADRSVIYLGEVTYRGDFIRIDMDLRP